MVKEIVSEDENQPALSAGHIYSSEASQRYTVSRWMSI